MSALITRDDLQRSLEVLKNASALMRSGLEVIGDAPTYDESVSCVGINAQGLPVLLTVRGNHNPTTYTLEEIFSGKSSKDKDCVFALEPREYLVRSIVGDRCHAQLLKDGKPVKDVEILFTGEADAAAMHYFQIQERAASVAIGQRFIDPDGSSAIVTSINFGMGQIGSSLYVGVTMDKPIYTSGDLAGVCKIHQIMEYGPAFPKYLDLSDVALLPVLGLTARSSVLDGIEKMIKRSRPGADGLGGGP